MYINEAPYVCPAHTWKLLLYSVFPQHFYLEISVVWGINSKNAWQEHILVQEAAYVDHAQRVLTAQTMDCQRTPYVLMVHMLMCKT